MASASNITRTIESAPHGAPKSAKANTGTPAAGAPNSSPSRTGRATEVRTVVHNSISSRSTEPREGGIERLNSPAPSTAGMSDRIRSMLASVDKHGDFRDAKPASAPAAGGGEQIGDAPAEGASEGGAAAQGTESAPAASETPGGSEGGGAAATEGDAPSATTAAPGPAADKAPTEPAKPAAASQPDPDLIARAARLEEHNAKLLAELETARAKPAAEPDEHTKTLHEIERNLSSDFVGSLRKLMALHAGLKEDSPDLDQLMAGGYSEWTAKELKLQLDPAQQASIGTRRNTLLIERDKRERDAAAKAAEAKAAADAEQRSNAEYARQLDTHLETVKHGEKYPLMMALAPDLDGMSPGALLRTLVQRGIKSGEIPKEWTGDKLTEHYSNKIEAHYQKHIERIEAVKAKAKPAAPPTSTAPQAQASDSTTDNKAGAPSNTGARTITNASASVAPASPPAATPSAPTPAGPPKRKAGESEHAFRRRAAAHFFPDS
jgi:hypothetical protein